MEESRVRYSKLSMMTATKRFSICGNPRGQDGVGGSETHPNTFTQRSGGREVRWRKGDRGREGGKGPGGKAHPLTRSPDREMDEGRCGWETEEDGDRKLEREGREAV